MELVGQISQNKTIICTIVYAKPELTDNIPVSIFQLGFVLGQAYYRKENYTDLELPAAVNRLKEMVTKSPMGLAYALGDSRGPSSTPKELIALVASQHCKCQTAKEVEAKPRSRKKQRGTWSSITGLKKRPYCTKTVQPAHIATGNLVFVFAVGVRDLDITT